MIGLIVQSGTSQWVVDLIRYLQLKECELEELQGQGPKVPALKY